MREKLTSEEIEKEIYSDNGLYFRVIKKITDIGKMETLRITGKRRTWIDIFIRQYRYPAKFDTRPKFDTIVEMAKMLEVK